MKHPVSASVLQREQAIQNEIAQLKLTDQEKYAVLARGVALTRIEFEFNSAAHLIFGSQISLLMQLSGTFQGLLRQQAEAIYVEAQKAFSELHGERKFEDWFNYLYATNLVSVNGERIDITPYGTDFLKYLVEARLTYNRHG